MLKYVALRGPCYMGRMMSTSPEKLHKLSHCSTQALVDALWVLGYPQPMIEGARPVIAAKGDSGERMVGNAVTLRFVPQRQDLQADKPKGAESAEYVAFELCGENEVLVASSVGPWESVGGDIKFLRLAQRNVAGLVTDGSVRDTSALESYGFPVYAHSTTCKQGPAVMQPWAVNDVISCGGVCVRPDDVIVGDKDGVMVIPESMVDEVLEIAQSREAVEAVIKEELEANPQSPGNFYPFSTPVAPGSGLAALLERRGVSGIGQPQQQRAFSSTAAARARTMRAVQVRTTGDASVLSVDDGVAVPEISDGQCLVKNQFAGLNFIDTYHRSGLYKRELPFTAGQEGAGTIEEVTPQAAALGLSVGDRVAYTVLGTYSEYTAVPAAKLLPVPDSVSLDVAAAAVVQGMTAHYLTQSTWPVESGDWCLVHAAAGGTGQLAVQMAKIRGARVIGTTSSPEKAALATACGADHVINYSEEDIVERVMEITGGEGVRVVYDGVGKSTWEASLDSLGARGCCIFFGNASGPVPPVDPLRLITKSLYITRPKLLDYTASREELVSRSSDIFRWIEEGSLNVSIDRTFALHDAADGHRFIEEGQTKGKVLFKV